MFALVYVFVYVSTCNVCLSCIQENERERKRERESERESMYTYCRYVRVCGGVVMMFGSLGELTQTLRCISVVWMCVWWITPVCMVGVIHHN